MITAGNVATSRIPALNSRNVVFVLGGGDSGHFGSTAGSSCKAMNHNNVTRSFMGPRAGG